jgi:hypothetical protein
VHKNSISIIPVVATFGGYRRDDNKSDKGYIKKII